MVSACHARRLERTHPGFVQPEEVAMIISRLFSGTFTPMKNNACKTPSNSKVAHLLAVSAVLLFASAALAQNPATFLQTPYYSGGGVVAVADFNGDGKPDIATSSGTLLLGNGD